MPIKLTILLVLSSPFKARAILREFIWKKKTRVLAHGRHRGGNK